MESLAAGLALISLLMWVGLLLTPWQAWRTREHLDGSGPTPDADLRDVTVLIPARNESAVIGRTLRSLKEQGQGLKVILVDDNSGDATAEVARGVGLENLEVLPGSGLAQGWTGKLWALEQGRKRIRTKWVLLLDADIALRPGLIKALQDQRHVNVTLFQSEVCKIR